MFYLRLERKYKKSSVFSGKATKKHFAASLINYKQALGGGGGREMIKMHNINPWRMKNKSNMRISENNKIGLVTGVFRAGLVPLLILLRVER